MKTLTIVVVALATVAYAWKPGTQKQEYHAPFSWQKCEAGNQCSSVQGSVVMDKNWRWKHDGMLEGVQQSEWLSNYGVTVSGNSARLNFVVVNPYAVDIGSRFYLLESDTRYQIFKLLGQEFSFDVDVSNVPCSVNGAFYLVEMDADGGMAKNSSETAGAKYGTGYCDAQCLDGFCCNEMDLWEANSMATALTPHPCAKSGLGGKCDSYGCGYNPYPYDKNYYGPGKTVDTNKVITVVTQFHTTDGTPNGDLKEIKRLYIQNGKVLPAPSAVSNSMTDAFCHSQQSFVNNGGLKQMGKALRDGMVLIFCIWDDKTGDMKWLDAGNNGPCPDAHVDVEKK